jgi:hypothetical protein
MADGESSQGFYEIVECTRFGSSTKFCPSPPGSKSVHICHSQNEGRSVLSGPQVRIGNKLAASCQLRERTACRADKMSLSPRRVAYLS